MYHFFKQGKGGNGLSHIYPTVRGQAQAGFTYFQGFNLQMQTKCLLSCLLVITDQQLLPSNMRFLLSYEDCF